MAQRSEAGVKASRKQRIWRSAHTNLMLIEVIWHP